MAAHRGELNHRLWLGFVEEQLVAVGAHEEATTLQVRGLWPTMLVVAAVALVWAGRLA